MVKRIRVMLVDDHPVVRAGYRRLLELEPDFEVVAEHGDVGAALAALAGGGARPDVVVADLAMPHRGGMELVQALAGRAGMPRVLVFSMHDSAPVVDEALRAGAAGFVTKGSAPEELVHCLRRVVVQSAPVLSADLAARRLASADAPGPALTLREEEVLRRLAAGETLQAIADALQISPKTVSNYQTVLRQKLGAATAVELLRKARARGFAA